MLTTTPVKSRLLSVTTGDAASDLFTPPEAKAWLNAENADAGQTVLIEGLIKAVAEVVEKETRRVLITRAVTVRHQASFMPLKLFRPPTNSITSITTYYQGADTTEDHTNFYILGGLGKRPKLFMKDDGEWVATSIEEIEIVTSNGYGGDVTSVPRPLVQAARQILSQFYDRRDDYIEGGAIPLPRTARVLMAPFVCPVI
jgi:uncharacterized phiE125 gp8 family phage protein